MLCVVCPHCHQMMTASEDAVGESVACPSCKKSLQVPPNAPSLPKHLAPGGGLPAAGHAKAAAGAAGGRVGAAVAAPPVPGAPPGLAATAPQTRSTLPKAGILVAVAVLALIGVVAVVVIPKLGGKKTPIVSKKKEIRIPGGDSVPPDPVIPASDLTSAALFKAYFDNSIAADENYRDKEVTVAGRVAAIHGEGEIFVHLYGVDRAKDLTKFVRCYFAKSQRDRFKTIANNQMIRVKGTCKGMADGRVVIRDCNFVVEE